MKSVRRFVTLLSLCLIWALAFATLPAWGGSILVQQQGATDPALNGFATDFGVSSQGPVGSTAWNIQGSWCCGYDFYSLTAAQITNLTTATNWAFTTTFQNLSLNTVPTGFGPDAYGTYADVSVNGVRFDLNMHTDGSGNQVLSLNPFGGSPNYTILALGTNYVTLKVLYNNSTQTADIFVNGTDVISGYGGHNNFAGNFVAFGGEDGNFSLVDLESNPSSVPEPATLLVLIPGLLAAGYGLRRKLCRPSTPSSAKTALDGDPGLKGLGR